MYEHSEIFSSSHSLLNKFNWTGSEPLNKVSSQTDNYFANEPLTYLKSNKNEIWHFLQNYWEILHSRSNITRTEFKSFSSPTCDASIFFPLQHWSCMCSTTTIQLHQQAGWGSLQQNSVAHLSHISISKFNI